MKNSKSEKILIIDDDVAVRTSLLLLLNNEGYEAAGADSPEQGMTLIKSGRYSLAILDLNFSIDTSGDEGIELLKTIKTTYALPVILITGWATIELAVKGMKLGASDFINKPWSNDYLLQSNRTVFELNEPKGEKTSRKKLDQLFSLQHIIGEDPKMLEILEMVGRGAH